MVGGREGDTAIGFRGKAKGFQRDYVGEERSGEGTSEGL